MQFSIATLAALAATATATYVPSYNTTSSSTAVVVPPYPITTSAYYPTGTGSPSTTVRPTGTGAAPSGTSSIIPFPGAASEIKAGSAFAMIVAGGVALFI
ncbi:hypothetical protein BU24DRAFT_462177 [Aaosphaeria arxii CBS 175.79]|uniref:Uncharacterized protein n=1 Tax=Aaosphaeria arxii CBS 175.79 TaxID=1450172 RepID=A0A6A5XTB7_9PLEO|nr:uncharacterized protein BU24DRAFT_462177 [Aaosphaeria arxii CBS 175.79]KAF2015961.1 hypothetical protein BU24DRAFT_462177 [Aaosphaeria arxii CBS 175.79]